MRGPDATVAFKRDGYTFIHNLLSITGTFTPQPFIDEEIVCVYNGEIYNHPYVGSDGEALIPLYKQYGEEFVRRLDGEFAIALFDFATQTAIFSTDAFRSKPIWVNEYGAASYRSGIGAGAPLPPNTAVVRCLKTGCQKTFQIHGFQFDHQHKDHYTDWINAFEAAVRKRGANNSFIGLSSGYDSGAIDCALTRCGFQHRRYSIAGVEDMEILRLRNSILAFGPAEYAAEETYIQECVEPFEYSIFGRSQCITEESAAIGLGYLCRLAQRECRRIYLSGQGADEILADYALMPHQSEFKGRFPDRLTVWRNFYHECQEAYLAKEEHVAGAYGIEARYPFLDAQVVQEFLWLKPELKNAAYKAPLHAYLTMHDYPFRPKTKRGFEPDYGVI
ncbi:MAG: hypothetical protein JO340_21175 [Acidobacteriaceae bacterium]|nr:hypothetical protein [Acidobacteriaceae bacterium]